MTQQLSSFACDMTAIDPSDRPRHLDLIHELFLAVESVDELADGYAFRFRSDADVLMKCAEFIANERRCCPFFGFELAVEPEDGAIWLRLRGSDGVKPFIVAEIGGALSNSVAEAAGFE